MASVEENLRKVPPQSLEAEESVLGAILIDNEACNLALPLLRADDFYREAHRKVFAAMMTLQESGSPVDAVTLTEALRQQGQLQAIGGAAFFAELGERVPTAANVEHYARIVREKALLRGLIGVATDIATQAYDARGNVEEVVDAAERRIFSIAEQRVKPSFYTVSELLPLSIKEVEKLYNRKELITGVPTGFHDLDKQTAGLQKNDLIIVAGRPGMGKTALALNMATHASIQTGLAVGIFSLEMAKEQLVLRMLCSQARVNYADVRSGHLKERDFARLASAAGDLHQAAIYIDDSAGLSILELRAKARRLVRDARAKLGRELGMIVVDYLQLMRGSGRTDSREQEISEISRSLKALAKELQLPVVALSQLNRRVEEGTDRRPVMAHLRESGAIEQDADLILFVYREAVYNRELSEDEERDAEIIIGKQRNGPTGTVHATFLREYMRFEDRAQPGDESFAYEADVGGRDYETLEP
jgi:replicative DNA helicase